MNNYRKVKEFREKCFMFHRCLNTAEVFLQMDCINKDLGDRK